MGGWDVVDEMTVGESAAGEVEEVAALSVGRSISTGSWDE